MLRLREAGIAPRALRVSTIIVSDQGICIRNFRHASASAPRSRLDTDVAAALAAMAVRAGAERTAAVAARVLEAGTARGALVHLQRSALDPGTVAALKDHKDLLPRLRQAVASGTGIDVPKLAEVKRVSWANLLFAVGSLIGIGRSSGCCPAPATRWPPSRAPAGMGGADLPIRPAPGGRRGWRCSAPATGQLPLNPPLRWNWTLNTFTALVGGDVAVFAVRVADQFFQRQGYDAAAAVSAGAIATTASWTLASLLFLIALPFAAGSFQVPASSGGHQAAVWVILAVILVAGIAATLITLVPRFRRLVSRRIRPHLLNIWANVKTIATEPRKLVYVLACFTLAQLLVILALRASLHSVGQHASIATLITVNTFTGIIGGAVPIPGGLGVCGGGPIAGLTAAGIPQDQAVAAGPPSSGSSPPTCPRCGECQPGQPAPTRIRVSRLPH